MEDPLHCSSPNSMWVLTCETTNSGALDQVDGKLLDSEGELVGRVPAEQGQDKTDGPIRTLCQQTVDNGHSVLVFCAAKKVITPNKRHCR